VLRKPVEDSEGLLPIECTIFVVVISVA